MQINNKITELKSALPLGSFTEIAKRLGITVQTVRNVFDLKKCRMKTTMAVIKESANIIAEYNETIDDAVTELNKHNGNEKAQN